MTHVIDKKLLPVAEWFAENAYISPGKHRLLTAAGLMVGLYTGHEMMNILTGKNNRGEDTDVQDLAPPLQKFHRLLAYNKYEDSPETKWHKIADAFVPLFFGAVGAMAGSSSFAKATPMMKSLSADLAEGSQAFRLQHADMLANKTQAKLLNFLSGFGLNMGSTSGVHLFPSMIASSTSAFRFQIDHGKNIILPGLRQLTHNRGHSSRNMFITMDDFISWAQSNAAHLTNEKWYNAETKPILKYAKDMLQVFKEVTPEQQRIVERRIEETCRELNNLAAAEARSKGGISGHALQKELARPNSNFSKKIKSFLSEGLEQSFKDAKLIDMNDLDKTMNNIALGDYGIVSKATRLLGGNKAIAGYGEQLKTSLKQRMPGGDKTARRVDKLMPNDRPPYVTSAGLVGGTLGATYLFGKRRMKNSDNHLQTTSREEQTAQPETETGTTLAPQQLSRHEQARKFHQQQHKPTGINGKPLDALNWMSSVLVVPPGLHRFMNAAFLSGFLYGGAKLSCALAARDLKGAHIAEENIWPILKPLYGKMEYVWKSAHTSDRWKHVAHQLMPVTIGMGGTYAGSRLYFQDAIIRANEANYLEDYTDRIALQESETYAKASALTSILNTGSGFHLLPFISYPSNLQNRFLMAKGQQIASPGIGKWWSGNPSKYPWHVRRHLNAMIDYAVNNTSEFPVEFDEMGYALLAKLYPDVPKAELDEKRDALLDRIYEVRDRFWQPGGIAADRKAEAKEALEGILRKEGLEHTLSDIGLSPLEANLDNNGVGGRLAHLSGAAAPVHRSIAEYRSKASKRLQNSPETPKNTIETPSAEALASLATHPAPDRVM